MPDADVYMFRRRCVTCMVGIAGSADVARSTAEFANSSVHVGNLSMAS